MQGYTVNDNIVYQDNKSAILLEKNGKWSSTKRTKHINIWYFFRSDRIAKGEVNTEWFPTGDMVADFMTKPLQGSLLQKFRDIIMGVKHGIRKGGNKVHLQSEFNAKIVCHRSVLGDVCCKIFSYIVPLGVTREYFTG